MTSTASGAERRDREASDFLSATTHSAARKDFHALRHTCGSWLAAAGVHPKIVQRIMRHCTITLTMDRYTHLFSGDEAAAIGKLPTIDRPGDRERRKATGTSDERASSTTDCRQNGRANGRAGGDFMRPTMHNRPVEVGALRHGVSDDKGANHTGKQGVNALSSGRATIEDDARWDARAAEWPGLENR